MIVIGPEDGQFALFHVSTRAGKRTWLGKPSERERRAGLVGVKRARKELAKADPPANIFPRRTPRCRMQ